MKEEKPDSTDDFILFIMFVVFIAFMYGISLLIGFPF